MHNDTDRSTCFERPGVLDVVVVVAEEVAMAAELVVAITVETDGVDLDLLVVGTIFGVSEGIV